MYLKAKNSLHTVTQHKLLGLNIYICVIFLTFLYPLVIIMIWTVTVLD